MTIDGGFVADEPQSFRRDVIAALQRRRHAGRPESGERAVAPVNGDDRGRSAGPVRAFPEEVTGERGGLVGDVDTLDRCRAFGNEGVPGGLLLRECGGEAGSVDQCADRVDGDAEVGGCPQEAFRGADSVPRGLGGLRGGKGALSKVGPGVEPGSWSPFLMPAVAASTSPGSDAPSTLRPRVARIS